ncbi:hypothetical protein SLS62_001582 [Diatrype stigma]|uniref:Heterokaryon incompatibility domain-containing protein n=1 Tax=Diatrype stigma TaxID=117547 RepID=A0AAN9UYQ3_9PEZI
MRLTDPTTPEVVNDESVCEACRLKREVAEVVKAINPNHEPDDHPAFDMTTPPGVDDLRWLGCKEASDVADSSDNAECFDKIKAWIEDCSQNHKTSCGPSPESSGMVEGPKRLIDTGPLEGNISLRLIDWPGSGGEPIEYCALSYSWGSDPTAHFTTTVDTYQQRRNGFEITQLPQTLRDAVVITRKVGCRFLWIDAVCIIQRDLADWEAESPRMHHIYGNAFLVIAATENTSPRDGIFSSRPPPVKFTFERAGKSYPITIRPDDHSPWREKHRVVETQSVPRQPSLHTRAWAYQERLLSTRIVHYTATELVWECNTCCRCECSIVEQVCPGNEYDAGKSLKSQFSGNIGTNKTWQSVILNYSVKKLTVGTDKLPALAGLAKRFASPEMGKYLAGIWHSQLPDALTWFSFGQNKPDTYRAPSWSWASVDGEIHGIGRSEFQEGVDCVEVLEAECTPASSEPFGAVSDGYIILKGLLAQLGSGLADSSGGESWALKMKSYGWSMILKKSTRVVGAWERLDAEHVNEDIFLGKEPSVVKIV